MSANFLISHRWAVASRFAIADQMGNPLFAVQSRGLLGREVAITDARGAEVAVISHRGLARSYQISASGQWATVTPDGLLSRRFQIDSSTGPLQASGNFSRRQYAVTRGGMLAVGVTQVRRFRGQFAVEVADGEDVVLMLAVVVVIETIKDQRRQHAGA